MSSSPKRNKEYYTRDGTLIYTIMAIPVVAGMLFLLSMTTFSIFKPFSDTKDKESDEMKTVFYTMLDYKDKIKNSQVTYDFTPKSCDIESNNQESQIANIFRLAKTIESYNATNPTKNYGNVQIHLQSVQSTNPDSTFFANETVREIKEFNCGEINVKQVKNTKDFEVYFTTPHIDSDDTTPVYSSLNENDKELLNSLSSSDRI